MPHASESPSEDAPRATDPTADPYAGPKAEVDPSAELKAAWTNVQEVLAYAQQYAMAKVDGVLLMVKRSVLLLVLLAVVGLIGATVTVTAAVLLVVGMAEGVSAAAVALFGLGWAWLGPFLVGLLLTVFIAGGTWMMIRMLSSGSRTATRQKYEAMLRAQQISFGRDAVSRARQAAQTHP